MSGRATVVLYALTLLFVLTLAISSVTFFDFWWYLASGERILAQRAVPSTDPFSYTAEGRPWVNHMWATQVLFVLVWQAWGRVGLILLKGAVVTLTFAVLLLTMRRRGVHPLVAVPVTLLAAWAGWLFWHVRPQVFTYLFLAVFLYLLREGWESRRRTWPLFPLLMVPWVNLHAGFLTGIATLGLVSAGTAMPRLLDRDRERRRAGWRILGLGAALTGATLLASLVNPYGVHAVLFPLEVVNTRLFMVSTYEWFSPNFHDPRYRGFEAMLLLLAPACAWGRARLRAVDLLLALVFAHLALGSVRHIPLFVVAAAPLLADALGAALADLWGRRAAWWHRLPRLRSRLPSLWPLFTSPVTPVVLAGFFVAVGLVAMGTSFLDPATNPFRVDLNEERYPQRAVTFIKRERLPGRLFNTYVWGGYELWRLFPEYQVFIDGRTHVYGKEILQDFLDVTNLGRGWEGVLERWGVQTILAERGGVLTQALLQTARWRLVFAEREAVVFVRDTVATQAVLGRLPAVALTDPTHDVRAALAAALAAAAKGDDEAAIHHFRDVLAMDPDHPAALLSLGLIREKRGETGEARALFERVVMLNPDGALAGSARERLGRLR